MYSITETQQIIIYYMNQLQISRREFGRSDVIFMFGSRRAALTSVIKFSFTKWREKKKTGWFHSGGNERRAERGNVPSVNKSTLQSSSFLFTLFSWKYPVIPLRTGW